MANYFDFIVIVGGLITAISSKACLASICFF